MSSESSPIPGIAGPSFDNALGQLLVYFRAKEERERKDAKWVAIKRTFWAVVAIGTVLLYLLFYANMFGVDVNASGGSVAVVPIHGQIMTDSETSAETVVPLIQKACDNDDIKQIVLDINSPGGAPNESERIVSAIESCRHDKHKKFTALIDGLGASAAYMISVHADRIVAGRYSIVGSVGAIMRYVDASAAVTRLGLRERIYRSGILKGGPSPMSGSDEAMDKVNQDMVVRLGEDFLSEVYTQRKGKLKAPRDEIFTGRIWTAPDALKLGLIDQIATLETLEATDFKDLKLHDYKPKTPFARGFGFSALLRESLRDALTSSEAPNVQ